ncbi:trypsin-like peptidase domain-containing protein [Fodinisporobacter ferrooxydans]|uniref:Trypsin-like peptidase domain-containing protein n=1 Tax=Fodinisporobacter ferrooxydans TaxID=2901836 RepID=A0ABY4CMI0_9BACL|nr:trypsin-like peptidase domain-containing protein [Alicyclobacillaceae bacterium MYW30-H2]
MGFYNHEYEREPRRPNKMKWVGMIVLSALVGSASTLAAVPFLLKSNVIAMPQASIGNNLTNTSAPVSNVTVKVNDGVVSAVNKVKAAIVGVVNYGRVTDFWTQNSKVQEQGEGSGIIFDKQGHIITNNHVVEGATSVEVLLPDGKKAKAKVIGTDRYSDLAVLQIPASLVTGVATFGNSDSLQVGEPAIAIGNPLGHEFNQTVTEGVISALSRTMPVKDEKTGQVLGQETVLQTDAAINPGNSGGALCNIEGQVIGINSAKIASAGVEGMGFAIPINEARPIIDDIMKYGHVNYPALGIGVRDVSQVPTEYLPQLPVDYGVFVIQVQSKEAKASGLQRGDVIVALDGEKITDSSTLHTVLFKHKIGDTVKLTVYRDGEKKEISVKLISLSSLNKTQPQGYFGGQGNGNVVP